MSCFFLLKNKQRAPNFKLSHEVLILLEKKNRVTQKPIVVEEHQKQRQSMFKEKLMNWKTDY